MGQFGYPNQTSDESKTNPLRRDHPIHWAEPIERCLQVRTVRITRRRHKTNHTASTNHRRSSCIRWLQTSAANQIDRRRATSHEMRLEPKARQVDESWRAESQAIRKFSPAHRRIAVGTTPFDVNRPHRALLSEIYGCHKSVSDRSCQTIRSAVGHDI